MPVIPLAARSASAHLSDGLHHITISVPAILRRVPIPHLATRSSHLESRAVAGIIPTYYVISGPSAGTTAGIVLGSVAGFLFLLWLFYSLFGGQMFTVAGEEEVVVRRRHGDHTPHSRRSRRSTHTAEVREKSRSPRRERIIVEERRERDTYRASGGRPRSVIVEERSRSRARVPGDDIVEVIDEEEIRGPRRGGRRGSEYGY